MRMSRRAQRMERKHRRNKGGLSINLVSLMDIFTILVFFLLVNSSDGEILPNPKSVVLPESVSEQQPRQMVVIMVNRDNVLMNGTVIASVADVMAAPGTASPAIITAMTGELQRLQERNRSDPTARMEATIMGDKDIPYSLFKKVMASATQSGYHRISLAVMQKPLEGV
jgi:biopolymer transport protein TolR